MNFSMFINVKIPTIGDILTFISVTNTVYESLNVRKAFIFQHFRFYEQNIGPDLDPDCLTL